MKWLIDSNDRDDVAYPFRYCRTRWRCCNVILRSKATTQTIGQTTWRAWEASWPEFVPGSTQIAVQRCCSGGNKRYIPPTWRAWEASRPKFVPDPTQIDVETMSFVEPQPSWEASRRWFPTRIYTNHRRKRVSCDNWQNVLTYCILLVVVPKLLLMEFGFVMNEFQNKNEKPK